MKNLLKANEARIGKVTPRTNHFVTLLREGDKGWLDPEGRTYARYILLNRSFMQKVWKCENATFISTAIQEEINYITKCCQEHLDKTYIWSRPISHIVIRNPDAKMRQDASTSWGCISSIFVNLISSILFFVPLFIFAIFFVVLGFKISIRLFIIIDIVTYFNDRCAMLSKR